MANRKTGSNGEAKPRGRKPKQGFLPDMEPPRIQEIDDASEEYVQRRDARMALLKEEVEAKEHLLKVLKTHKVKKYNTGTYTIEQTATLKDDVTVKRNKSEKEGDEDE